MLGPISTNSKLITCSQDEQITGLSLPLEPILHATHPGFIKLWAIGSCLVSGSGTIKAEEYCLLKSKHQIEEGWFSIG